MKNTEQWESAAKTSQKDMESKTKVFEREKIKLKTEQFCEFYITQYF